MNEAYIIDLLEKVRDGYIKPETAYEELKDLPYRDLGFAKVDHHREIRTGFPEVIFSQGKTPAQISRIFTELYGSGAAVMATRADSEDFRAVKEVIPEAVFYRMARIIAAGENLPPEYDIENRSAEGSRDSRVPAEGLHEPEAEVNGIITVVCAGTADIPVAEEAAVTAQIMGNRVNRVYDVGVAGIHRLFDRLDKIREADVVIAAAGMEGALASVVGGLVSVPMIAVPTSVGYGTSFGGISALLAMLNSCANGIGVVNIDNGYGAAYLASLITKRISENTGGR
jgi:NCAIR mutase (PurE)-related protein